MTGGLYSYGFKIGQRIEVKGWRLTAPDGLTVKAGEVHGGFTIRDGRPPHKPASAGFIEVTERGHVELYAHVAGLRWIHPNLRPR